MHSCWAELCFIWVAWLTDVQGIGLWAESSSEIMAAGLTSIASAWRSKHDLFADPIDVKLPPRQIASVSDHPVPRLGIQAKPPLQTNKFYANLHLGDQRGPTYTFPYSVAWAGGSGPGSSWGLACSHIEAEQRVFGPTKFDGASSYFFNPVGIQSMILSAKELGNTTALTSDSITAFSARMHLSQSFGAQPSVSFPLVQGMAYVTGEYYGSVPLIQTGVFFRNVARDPRDPKVNLAKYTFTLEDGSTWRLYSWRTRGDQLDLRVVNNCTVEASKPFTGIIQVTKDPLTLTSEKELDDGAGIYATTLSLSGSTENRVGRYSFHFHKHGHQTGELHMYALPHHIASFDSVSQSHVQLTKLQSTTKGIATLVRGSQWNMEEPSLPNEMGFAPWHPQRGSCEILSDYAKGVIKIAAEKEISQDMMAQCNLDSMYFSGKALAKFATILYVIHDLIGDQAWAKKESQRLKEAFAVFQGNRQKYPLVHENAWGGIVSSASYVTRNDGVDFGNTYYNDHHFHYGYHILAAAMIGHIDTQWVSENRDYVNALVRDVANPSSDDKYFPMWRSFDWYHGHSWAHGLYPAMDGKDQESSSEDMMHAFAIKMWGKVSGDNDMESRANLQLAIMSRSLNNYYLYQKTNKNQPTQFIGNKVAGILFENKIDHTTYFDPNIEAIQGIHIIPILPSTPYARVKEFVEEEWEAFFSGGRIDNINNAWKGIVYGSYATIHPKRAWDFFSAKDFDSQWIDGGASLTWFLAYSATLGNI